MKIRTKRRLLLWGRTMLHYGGLCAIAATFVVAAWALPVIRGPSYVAAPHSPLALREVFREEVQTFREAIFEQEERCGFGANRSACHESVNLVRSTERTLEDLCTKLPQKGHRQQACIARDAVRKAYVETVNGSRQFLYLEEHAFRGR